MSRRRRRFGGLKLLVPVARGRRRRRGAECGDSVRRGSAAAGRGWRSRPPPAEAARRAWRRSLRWLIRSPRHLRAPRNPAPAIDSDGDEAATRLSAARSRAAIQAGDGDGAVDVLLRTLRRDREVGRTAPRCAAAAATRELCDRRSRHCAPVRRAAGGAGGGAGARARVCVVGGGRAAPRPRARAARRGARCAAPVAPQADPRSRALLAAARACSSAAGRRANEHALLRLLDTLAAAAPPLSSPAPSSTSSRVAVAALLRSLGRRGPPSRRRRPSRRSRSTSPPSSPSSSDTPPTAPPRRGRTSPPPQPSRGCRAARRATSRTPSRSSCSLPTARRRRRRPRRRTATRRRRRSTRSACASSSTFIPAPSTRVRGRRTARSACWR